MAAVFEHYRPRLERMADVRLDSRIRARVGIDDVIQEAYLEAARRLPEYLRERKLPFYLWLRFILGQVILKAHRREAAAKRDVGREVSLDHGANPGEDVPVMAEQFLALRASPSSSVARQEILEVVKRALSELEPLDREVLVLRYCEDLSNLETAQVLGITEAAASQRHVRAIRKLGTFITGLI